MNRDEKQAGSFLPVVRGGSSLTLEEMAERLGDVTHASAYRYGARDDRGVTLDSLKVAAVGQDDFLGVSHAMRDGRFQLNLAHSRDLMTWRHVATLDENASQGEIARAPDGAFWVAYEHGEPNSVFIRLRRYADRAALEPGRFACETTLGRTLAPTAEGTPSFERITPDAVTLRFHFYRSGDVDRAARGELRNFVWQAKPDAALNRAVEAHGIRGNIGGRSRFRFQGKWFYAQEGQRRKNDWTSWRVFLLDDPPRRAVPWPIRTHRGSKSFANPFVLPLPGPRLFVSLFLPSEGSAPGESGELLFVRDLS